MNVAAFMHYVALFCLLAFTAFSNALHAQSTEAQTESSREKTTSTARTVVVRSVGSGTAVSATSEAPEAGKQVKVLKVNTCADGAEPKSLVIEKQTENGKSTITVNGREIESGGEIPVDVLNMLDELEVSVDMDGDGTSTENVKVFRFNSGKGNKSSIRIFSSDTDSPKVIELGSGNADGADKLVGNHVWMSAPHCRKVGTDSTRSFKFNFKFDNEAMQKHFEEMQERCMSMRLDTTMNHCFVSIHKRLGEISDSSVAQIPIPPMPVFMMNGETDVLVNIPEFPAIKSFETDDLGDVQELYTFPDGDIEINVPPTALAPDVQKRYRVIIIERPDAEKGMKEEVEALAPAVETEIGNPYENTLPSGVSDNAIKAEYFNVYPNPTPGALNISFALTQPGTVRVTVSDLLGNSVFSESIERLNGQYYKQLNMDGHARGTYIVRVEQNGQVISRTVAVQ